jgi:crotonobetainyl-CoA:carnitine CoA-transferase CaiB-like acyl-CoA transferase
MKPLEGVFVLDLTLNLPGPYCGMLLADFGATVVKVERFEGDPTRLLPPFADQDGSRVSVAFRATNAGKRSVAIDLKKSEGRALFLDLVAGADVVLDGFRPGVLDRLGAGEKACRERNPRIVFAAITGFGSDGPYRDRAGHDLTYLALAGALSSSSAPLGVQVADMGGALAAFSGVVLALLAREKTNKGQTVAASLFGTSVALQPFQLVSPARGERSLAAEMLSGAVPRYRIYGTKDGRSVALAALEPKFWETFCELVGKPEWVERGHDPDLIPEVSALFASKTFDEWRLLENSDCCLAGVLSPEEAVHDPQVEALGGVLNAPDGKPARLKPPFDLEGCPVEVKRAPSTIGEHTAEVLLERLGLDADALRSLRERGVVA